ncbi:BZ3500_MvSof-1268-A1-R1_Chr2-2g04894 [Microbotryum saponariae]|uniref:BZ3500_MvSof-1268-A1-R1_Chr2-2g04894 protein n=1 Tax=Microbotryum saponariae TaxID=289078 RepID=A0A2X0K863_9BASI|nr:BZ3500_MvSof-1268-A1-R1_Chr2-2g04894 [Microbotryum saponariae]SDA00425.1 BZ3501_MvSof-1269-A2-R1_Chr2-2g04568 [Microbotryum saponariae]
MIDETDDNTDERADFDMNNGACRLEEWDFNADDDGSDDETS